jgi:hypothetical protein
MEKAVPARCYADDGYVNATFGFEPGASLIDRAGEPAAYRTETNNRKTYVSHRG